VLAVLLVAVALGLSNLAASIGIGISGIGAGVRVRVAVVFGLFEAGMPLLGLALGHGVASSLGHAARWLGGAILVAIGCYGLVQAWRTLRHQGGPASVRTPAPAPAPAAAPEWRLGRMVATGLALSLDNLAAGFALGTYHVAFGVAAALFGVVSVGMSLAGLEFGARIGTTLGTRSELAAGTVLVAVGAAMAAGAL
jgi:manganese efflux pump family protein